MVVEPNESMGGVADAGHWALYAGHEARPAKQEARMQLSAKSRLQTAPAPSVYRVSRILESARAGLLRQPSPCPCCAATAVCSRLFCFPQPSHRQPIITNLRLSYH
jgi:hypothetical protein